MHYRRLALVPTLLFAFACASTGPAAAPSPSPVAQSAGGKRNLTVMLYPWIPDAAGDKYQNIVQYVTTQFEAQNPNINLTVVMDQNCAYCNTYSPVVQQQIFTSQTPTVFNAVELDTINLGDLVSRNYVPPVAYSQANQFQFAGVSSSVNGTAYAIPTWVCSYFFYFGPDAAPAAAGRTQQRRAAPMTGGAGWVNGVWSGSWTLSSLYLTAVADTLGYSAVAPAMTQPINQTVAGYLEQVLVNCTANSANPCLNGTYANSPAPGVAQQAYVQGQYTNTTGYSESSFYISQAGGKMPSMIEPMVLSYVGSNNPLAFTDALVVNSSACTGQCVQDVYSFAAFYNSTAVRNYICFSQDATVGTPPRRLSPAIASFWSQPVVSSDAWYKQFAAGFATAQAYPNQGLQAAHGSLNQQLCAYLQSNGIPDACANLSPAASETARPGLHKH